LWTRSTGSTKPSRTGSAALSKRLQRRAAQYDKSGDAHYNLISALHKSVRGSDPDAALYWFARMLEGGEDPRFLARRLTRMAVEDIGHAAYVAYKGARRAAKETGSAPPPKHILNAATSLLKDQGYGAGYAYDHDAEDGFSGQNYFPDGLERPELYAPVERGFERELKKRMEYFAKLRQSR